MERLALRDLAVEILVTNRRDEIGAMARALQIFKDNGLKLDATETAAAEARTIADLERAASEAARADCRPRERGFVTDQNDRAALAYDCSFSGLVGYMDQLDLRKPVYDWLIRRQGGLVFDLFNDAHFKGA